MIPKSGCLFSEKNHARITGQATDLISAKLDRIPSCGCVSEVSHTPLECGAAVRRTLYFKGFMAARVIQFTSAWRVLN